MDGSRVLRILDFPAPGDGVTFELREEIRRSFLGYATLRTGDAGQLYISRLTPHFYPAPNADQGPYLYARSFPFSEVRGEGDSENTILHAPGDQTALTPRWRANIEYESNSWDTREDGEVLAAAGPLSMGAGAPYPDEGDSLRQGWELTRSISKRIEHSGRVIPLRQGALKLVGITKGGKPVPTAEPFPLNESIDFVHYLHHGVPLTAVPVKEITACKNCVNDGVFDGYPEGCLLLTAAGLTIRRDPFGQRVADLLTRFMYVTRFNGTAALGHNAVPRVHDGGVTYTLVSTDGSADKTKRPYKYRDLGGLFRPDQPP